MIGRQGARTGIDLGSASVKLVRGVGKARLERITHAAIEPWDAQGGANGMSGAAQGLLKLLAREGLRRGDLGRLAVSMGAEEASFREVVMPELTEAELAGALRFEARKHLNLDELTDAESGEPVLTFQILGPAPAAEDGGREMRVLLAAVSRKRRQAVLEVLRRAGLDPEVIDLEPLAGLNALFGQQPAGDEVLALVDLGARQAAVHVSARQGGFFSRSLSLPAPAAGDAPALAPYAENLRELIRETFTFYRGRFRREIRSIYLGGGGALLPGLAGLLRGMVDWPVAVFDPLEGLLARAPAKTDPAAGGARFVTACGLCRWWDAQDV